MTWLTTVVVPAPLDLPPDKYQRKKIFLAGGITGCPDWQAEAIKHFEMAEVTLLNPRRDNFPIDNPEAGPVQIRWEHNMLRAADCILFWFCAETIQPIVLYELGAWSMTSKPIAVGTDGKYPRRLDVWHQTALARPEVEVRSTLEETCRDAGRMTRLGRT